MHFAPVVPSYLMADGSLLVAMLPWISSIPLLAMDSVVSDTFNARRPVRPSTVNHGVSPVTNLPAPVGMLLRRQCLMVPFLLPVAV